jgi:antirestriction protein ArdC
LPPRALTKEEKLARFTALHEMLEQARQAYENDPEQRARVDRMLACICSLDGHPYSLNNMQLLERQATARGMTLTRLGTFLAWRNHGRSVRKGERGLMAYAPHPHRKDQSANDGNDEEEGDEKTGFHVVHLFDQSQTDPIEKEEP